MIGKWRQFGSVAAVWSLCFLILGIAIVLYPEMSALTICWILGVLCIALGIYALIRYFKLGFSGVFFRFDLTLGIARIIIGVLLITHPTGAVSLLPIAAGIYLILSSVFDIQLAVELRRFGMGNWIISLLLGVAGAVLAFLLFADPFKGAAALMVLLGVSLIVNSLQELYLLFSISRTIKSGKLRSFDPNAEIIDAEWTDVD